MARIQGTTGTAPPARRKPPPKKKPFVLQGGHDVGVTRQPARYRSDALTSAQNIPRPKQPMTPQVRKQLARAEAPFRPPPYRSDRFTTGVPRPGQVRKPKYVGDQFTTGGQDVQIRQLADMGRLLRTGLDYHQPPARRLAALRELRVRHGVPMTQRDYLNAITPRQKVHKHSFLHKALHAVEKVVGVGQVGPRPLGDYPIAKLPGLLSKAYQPGGATFKGGGYPLARTLRDIWRANQTRYSRSSTGAMLSPSQSGVKTAGFDPTGAILGIAALSSKASRAIANVHVPLSVDANPAYRDGIGKIARNAVADTIDLPAQTLASTWLSIHDPGSVAKSTLDTLKHPVKSFEQHPVSTALIFKGLEGGISRLAGEGKRAVVPGASRERLPLRLVGNATVSDRKYSKGLFEETAQRAQDKRALRKRAVHVDNAPQIARLQAENEKIAMRVETETTRARRANGQGKHLAGAKAAQYVQLAEQRVADNHAEIARLKAQEQGKPVAIQATKRQMHGFTGQGGHLGRRIDIQLGKHQALERHARGYGYGLMHDSAVKGPLSAPDAVPLIAEGVIKTGSEHRPATPLTVGEDLRSELKRLTDPKHLRELTPAELEDNAANVKIVDGLLKNQKFVHNPSAEIKAAAHYATQHGMVENERIGYKDLVGSQARRRVLLPFAVREMGLKFNDKTQRFEDASGRVVRDKEIMDAFHKAGGDPAFLAYVPQRPNFKGSSNFRAGQMMRRPGAETKRFHGLVTNPGAYQRDYEVLAQQLARAHTRAESHRTVNSLISQYGVRRSDGNYFHDVPEAEKEGRAQELKTGIAYVAVRAGRKNAMDALEGDLNPGVLDRTFTPAKEGDKDNIVLMPAPVLTRTWHHEIASAKVPVQRAAQSVMSRFRHVVLPTSPRWPVGNVVENELRIGMHDPTLGLASIPRGAAFERRLAALKGPNGERLGERLVQELRAAGAAGHFGSQQLYDIFRAPSTDVGKWVQALRDAHGPKEVADAWDGYKRLVFGANERMELGIYFSALDRFSRDQVKGWSKDWMKALGAQGDALQEVAKAFVDPRGQIDQNKVTAFVKMLDDMRGRYSNLSPSARWTVMTLTPFAPWYVNALYFSLVTLPKTHPLKTALLAAMYDATQKKRGALGLTHFPEKGGPKPLPGFLQGAMALSGGFARYSYYTPFGAFSDPLASAADLVLPQYSFLKNMAGLNWKNQPLKDMHGAEPDILMRALIAMNTAAESFVPFARYGRQLREGGGTTVDTSTIVRPQVKPGTYKSFGTAAKKLNPFGLTGNKNFGAKSYSGPPLKAPVGGIDWSKVDWGKGGGGNIDWSKVNWGAAK